MVFVVGCRVIGCVLGKVAGGRILGNLVETISDVDIIVEATNVAW
jgi:hypothetical protein